jgi:hypothetical protein
MGIVGDGYADADADADADDDADGNGGPPCPLLLLIVAGRVVVLASSALGFCHELLQ